MTIRWNLLIRYGETALTLSLTSYVIYDIWMGDHFAIELIRKGANIQGVSSEGDTLLHCALDREFIKVAILLIERGIDVNIVNSEGYSPLEASLRWWSVDNQIELVSALLIYGADPFFVNQYGYSMFELAVLNENGSSVETLLYLHTFDEYSNKKIHLEVLLKLAQVESFVWWDHIMDTFSVYEDSFDACVCRCVICFTDVEYFNIQ
jgi:ankyrin repeat protein